MSLKIKQISDGFKSKFEISDNTMLFVAVSGGCDSMVLLHALKSVHNKITVAHVNYKLRGQDSMIDANLVERIAESHQLPFEKLDYDLQTELNENGGNLQEKAREVRYLFFEQLVGKHKEAKLILAHHQGDQIENFWMQMARGGGLRAMSGMKEINNNNVIRPFLSISKDEIKSYALENSIEWREDLSNQKNTYTRNIWRNVLIPELTTINNQLDESVKLLQGVFLSQVKDDQASIKKYSQHKENGFLFYFSEMKDLSSNQWIELLNMFSIPLSMSASILELLTLTVGKKASIQHEKSLYKTIWREEQGLYFESINELKKPLPEFTIAKASTFPSEFSKNEFYFVSALISSEISIRRWQQGDRIHPIGVPGSKLVSDILKDAKVPLRLRKDQFVLIDKAQPLALIDHCVDRRMIAEACPCLKVTIKK